MQHVKASPKKMYKNCRVHDLPLMYHCFDCQTAICADCGMIDEKVHQPRPSTEAIASNPAKT